MNKLTPTLALAGPWLIALAPAWFVYDAMTTQLGTPWLIAAPILFVLICVGSAVIALNKGQDHRELMVAKGRAKVELKNLYLINAGLVTVIKGLQLEIKHLESQRPNHLSPGFVYILRREDGVYKIGRSIDTGRRLMQHIQDYGMGFELIQKWITPNACKFEQLALSLTDKHAFQEGGRLELRQFNDEQLEIFIKEFSELCKKNISN